MTMILALITRNPISATIISSRLAAVLTEKVNAGPGTFGASARIRNTALVRAENRARRN
jgi:hypothetical protein